MNRIIEECLREIVDKAALLRYLTSLRMGDEIPDQAVLSGISDVCGEIESLARAVKRALPVDALNESVRWR